MKYELAKQLKDALAGSRLLKDCDTVPPVFELGRTTLLDGEWPFIFSSLVQKFHQHAFYSNQTKDSSTPIKPKTEWNQLFGLPFRGQKS